MVFKQCEPIHGYGFRRGGYQCRCKPGYRLPNTVRRPYLGEIIERATREQHKDNFQCDRIGCKKFIFMFLLNLGLIQFWLQGFKSNRSSGDR